MFKLTKQQRKENKPLTSKEFDFAVRLNQGERFITAFLARAVTLKK